MNPASIGRSLLLLLLLSATPLFAQGGSEFGSPLGELYLSLDPATPVSSGEIDVAAPFDFYLVAAIDYADIGSGELNGVSGLRAWEASVGIPPEVTVVDRDLQPPTSVNASLEIDNWIVGTGQMLPAGPAPHRLVTYRAIVFDAFHETIVSLQPAQPSSFTDAPSGPAPGWQDWHALGLCPSRCLRTFASWHEGSLTLRTFGGPSDNLLVEVGSGSGDPSSSIEVPVVVWFPAVPKADPEDFSGMDLELTWDGALAALTDVQPAAIAADFEVAFNADDGHAVISMAAAEGIALVDRVPLFTLVFDAGAVQGETPLQVVSAEAFDGNLDAYPVDALDGSLAVGCTAADVFADGSINAADAIATLKIAIGEIIPSEEQFCAADMNHDEVVNSGDAVLILRKAVGLEKAGDAGSATLALTAVEPARLEVELSHVAGLDLTLQTSGDLVFDQASALEGLVLGRAEDGQVRLRFAAPVEHSLPVRLEFSGGTGVARVVEAAAYDVRGARKELTILADQATLGAVPTLSTALLGAAPNPFNPNTRIRFSMAERGAAQIHILDASGRRVKTFDLPEQAAGEASVTWNGQDDRGRRVASGVYFVQLHAAGAHDTERITLLK